MSACFAAETPVETEDGEKPIADIAVGDKVWSQDEVTGERELRPVVQKFVTPDQALLDLDIAVGSKDEVLRATPTHRFWVDGKGWTHAEDLRAGDTFDLYAGNHAVFVRSVRESARSTVYNLEVEGTHTYFVGDSGVWVHNACGPGALPRRPPGAMTPGKFVGWARGIEAAGNPLSAADADAVVSEARDLGVAVRGTARDLEGLHPNTPYDGVPHFHIGESGVHIPVTPGYKLPP